MNHSGMTGFWRKTTCRAVIGALGSVGSGAQLREHRRVRLELHLQLLHQHLRRRKPWRPDGDALLADHDALLEAGLALLLALLGLRGQLLLHRHAGVFVDLRRDRADVDADAMFGDAPDGLGEARLQRQRVGADLAGVERQAAVLEPRAQLARLVDRLGVERLLGVAVVAHRGAVARLEAAGVDGRNDLHRPQRKRPHLELRDRACRDGAVRARQGDQLERPDAGCRAVVARRRQHDAELHLAVTAAGPERHEERRRRRHDRPVLRQSEHGEVVVVDDLALVADRRAVHERRAGIDGGHAAGADDGIGGLQDERRVAARRRALGNCDVVVLVGRRWWRRRVLGGGRWWWRRGRRGGCGPRRLTGRRRSGSGRAAALGAAAQGRAARQRHRPARRVRRRRAVGRRRRDRVGSILVRRHGDVLLGGGRVAIDVLGRHDGRRVDGRAPRRATGGRDVGRDVALVLSGRRRRGVGGFGRRRLRRRRLHGLGRRARGRR